MPDVPAQPEKFFLSKPASGKITELIGKQEAWLEVGVEAGILQGMILTARQLDDVMFSQVRVEEVEKARCRITCQWGDNKLAVGQTVSTRMY